MAKLSVSLITVTIVLFGAILLTGEGVTSQKGRTKKTIIRRRKLQSVTEVPPTVIDSSTQENVVDLNGSGALPATTPLFLSTRGSPHTEQTTITVRHMNSSNTENSIFAEFGSTGNDSFITCPETCNLNNCVQPQECPSETVRDHCSCCHICAAMEGQSCFNETLNLPLKKGMGVCGSNLDCLLRNDLNSDEPAESLCQCRDKRMVCGIDNVTYSSECKLRESAQANPNLAVQSWYPCVIAPIISESFENVTTAVGEEISLNCEVRAFPAPTIHWQFLDESSSLLYTLPGDDPSVVVTIRGGPERTMTSSWIQVLSVSPRRQGIYFCIAKNSEGMTRQQMYLSVYNNNGHGSEI